MINPSVCASVCLSVCLSVCEHISGTTLPICTKFCVQMPCGRGSVILWRCCATLCTSGLWMTSCVVIVGAIWACMDLASWSIAHFAVLWDWGGVWCLWVRRFGGDYNYFTAFLFFLYIKSKMFWCCRCRSERHWFQVGVPSYGCAGNSLEWFSHPVWCEFWTAWIHPAALHWQQWVHWWWVSDRICCACSWYVRWFD